MGLVNEYYNRNLSELAPTSRGIEDDAVHPGSYIRFCYVPVRGFIPMTKAIKMIV